MNEQTTKTWVQTNRCTEAFGKKSNPNRPTTDGNDQMAASAGDSGPYPKRCNPRRAKPPLTAEQKDLVEKYIPLAYSIAKKRNIRRLRLRASDEIHEMRSVAALALVDAAGRFDPTRGVNFAVYSKWRIEGSLLDFERRLLCYNWQGRLDKRPRFRRLSLGMEEHGRVLFVPENDPVGTRFDAIDEVEVRLRPLPPLHAKACRLIYLEGKSQEEAAKALGYSTSYFCRIHQAALGRIEIVA